MINQYLQKLENDMTSSAWLDGKKANIIHLTNSYGMSVSFMDIGATWLSCMLPIDEQGREVLLRSKNMAEHIKQTAFFGSTVGRYANRIGNSQFHIGTDTFDIVANEGVNSLHGGKIGFDKKRWKINEQTDNSVIFELFSEDGDQGYPGNLNVEVCYELTDDNELSISYRANVDKACPVNLTNHAYFNLAGEGSDKKSTDHLLQMVAKSYLPTKPDMLPTGKTLSVLQTGFDFNHEKQVGLDFLKDSDQVIAGGYDHAFLFDAHLCDGKQTVATLCSPNQDVIMQLATTKPSVQFYSGNFLDGAVGANKVYQKYDGLALETQYLPDGPNHLEWGKSAGLLETKEDYHHKTVYGFIFNT
ncbi:galactose-1-epimerase [Vibrio rumoiensis]|uniref:Aldose 1-epimerase n=1 Tax=Vibrio rumoiensis 1S-45 TaxID=1188252 RepID=A0A1E5E2K7_9VIBR|nr:galactose-1-epimerase [Vibrio rumoiensis]OEF25767.1 galactose-1-epimerase [Vibrio rumoiensis 1S-45]